MRPTFILRFFSRDFDGFVVFFSHLKTTFYFPFLFTWIKSFSRKGKPLYPALSIDTDEICLLNFGGKEGNAFAFDRNLPELLKEPLVENLKKFLLLSPGVGEEDEPVEAENEESEDDDGNEDSSSGLSEEGSGEDEEESIEGYDDATFEDGEDEERRMQMGPDFNF